MVNNSTSLVFSYAPEYLVTFRPKLLDDQTVTITVDGTAYTDVTPFTVGLWYTAGSSTTFSITPTKLLNIGGKNYSLVDWKDQTGKTVRSPQKVRGPLVFTAQYAISDLTLTVYDLPGAAISLGGVTKTVPDGASFVIFDITNGTYALSTTDNIVVTEGKIRIAFVNWRIPKSTGTEYRTASINVTITGNSIVAEVGRSKQYSVVVSSQYGNPQGAGWYAANTTATISVTSPVDHGNSTRHAFVRWSGDFTSSSSPSSVFLDSPKTILAEWKVQYKLAVSSQYGTASGDGWYDQGSTATFSTTPPTEDGVRYIFTGWSGDFTGTERTGRIVMDGPKSVSAGWRRQYFTSMTFSDTKDAQLNQPPTRVVFSAPGGNTTTFTSYSGLWLDEGTWVLKQVIWHGVDVKKNEMSFNPTPAVHGAYHSASTHSR